LDQELVETFNSGHDADPVVRGWRAIYAESFLQYQYIASRSSNPAFVLLALQFIWMVTVALFAQSQSRRERGRSLSLRSVP
jgi:hypothetical protein